MGLVHVVFLERALVEKNVEPFARGQLALGVLRVDAVLAAAERASARLSSSCSRISRIKSLSVQKPAMSFDLHW